MGCAVSLPLILVSLYGLTALLDWALEPPPGRWRYVDYGVLGFLAVVLTLTAHTDFSSGETSRGRTLMAWSYFGAWALSIGAIVAVRAWPLAAG
jgi:hypothetical protein